MLYLRQRREAYQVGGGQSARQGAEYTRMCVADSPDGPASAGARGWASTRASVSKDALDSTPSFRQDPRPSGISWAIVCGAQRAPHQVHRPPRGGRPHLKALERTINGSSIWPSTTTGGHLRGQVPRNKKSAPSAHSASEGAPASPGASVGKVLLAFLPERTRYLMDAAAPGGGLASASRPGRSSPN